MMSVLYDASPVCPTAEDHFTLAVWCIHLIYPAIVITLPFAPLPLHTVVGIPNHFH